MNNPKKTTTKTNLRSTKHGPILMLLKSLYLLLKSQNYARKHQDAVVIWAWYMPKKILVVSGRETLLEKSVRKERRLDFKDISVEGSRRIGLGIRQGFYSSDLHVLVHKKGQDINSRVDGLEVSSLRWLLITIFLCGTTQTMLCLLSSPPSPLLGLKSLQAEALMQTCL